MDSPHAIRQAAAKFPLPPKTFTPTGSFVALYIYKTREGVIALPEGSENPNQAPIAMAVAVGPDCEQVKEGNLVICNPVGMAVAVIHDGHRYLIQNEEHLIGVLTDEQAEKFKKKMKDEGTDGTTRSKIIKD